MAYIERLLSVCFLISSSAVVHSSESSDGNYRFISIVAVLVLQWSHNGIFSVYPCLNYSVFWCCLRYVTLWP